MSGNRRSKRSLNTSARDLLQHWNDYYINTNFGLGVQCSECQKWRLTHQYQESKEVPEDWTCSMWKMGKRKRGNCGIPSDLTEEDFAREEYPPGTVVWAKLPSFPSWPAMIEDSPDSQEFFGVNENGEEEYHVNFFGAKPLRSWVKASLVKEFHTPPIDSPSEGKRAKRSLSLKKAIAQAEEASKLPIKERLKTYSFAVRYRGKWAKIKNKDEISLPPTSSDVKESPKPAERKSSVPNETRPVNGTRHRRPAARKRKTTDPSKDEVVVKKEPEEEEPPACWDENNEARNEVRVKQEPVDEDDQQSPANLGDPSNLPVSGGSNLKYPEGCNFREDTERNSIQSVDGNEEVKLEEYGATTDEEGNNDSDDDVVETGRVSTSAASPISIVISSDSEEEESSPEMLAYEEFLRRKFPSFIEDPPIESMSDADDEDSVTTP